jgi:MFS transporter, DHA2 family, multidrug resistance protein
MFRDTRVSVALVANGLAYFVLYGTQLAIAQYLQLVVGLTPLWAGLWTLPAVVAYLLASLFGPGLVRWFPAGAVIAAGLAAMTAGFLVLAGAGVAGLPAAVAGAVLFSIGLAPVYILTTDLVVTTVRPQRAGMAAAVTETGAELGGALGIAVLGSIGLAAYRHGMGGAAVRFGLPADGTLADAVVRAADLPALAGAELRRYAEHAYLDSFVLMSLAAAVAVAVAAILAAVVLRRPRSAPDPDVFDQDPPPVLKPAEALR